MYGTAGIFNKQARLAQREKCCSKLEVIPLLCHKEERRLMKDDLHTKGHLTWCWFKQTALVPIETVEREPLYRDLLSS